MAQKKILSIGFKLASKDIEYGEYNDDISLLDWDIILFKPKTYFYSTSEHQGKPSLSDRDSFLTKERAEHWRKQINEALVHGKTVIIYLEEFCEFYIDTGQRSYSGTGRNQKTTKHVALYDNYQCLPIDLSPSKAKGKEIKIESNYASIISAYWDVFGNQSNYMVTISSDKITPILITKTGNKVVGGFYKPSNSLGSLIFLPKINFEETESYSENSKWSQKAMKFAAEFVNAIVSLSKFMKEHGDITPEPDWSRSNEYLLDKEIKINQKLNSLEEQLSKIQRQKEVLIEELQNTTKIRGLLYEKGIPLEHAIIESLKVLGFSTSQYKDDNSEFDVIFESQEGRLLGEAEGKDNQPVNIDKLRQLSMNIHEDLMREEVEYVAKGVLFGNSYRLKPLHERNEPFTAKCLTSASTNSTALVFTPDLFKVTLYLSNNIDLEFAAKCRESILNTNGRVVFPDTPKPKAD
ncbi:TPA: hypothetical protein ACUNL2_000385 [Legionella pneumophila]|uniref:hypothetical protein n=1 Tax=Legionella pneumophila TaxID=446 RepID=UPI00077743F5|nr:hypothetical protein [Legionella pneumophila]HAU0830369.1 hypothetical protein [Legionella pneumophila]HBD7058693.1 hypothetical protein [Legionella pneumophila]HCQ3573326.1 hypothetical protein [Legionella pneumophila]HEM7040271.1 hypothetical protein [Legionella pneumophila]HEO1425851.1 hypothetical protein [Legionella pneumophila]